MSKHLFRYSVIVASVLFFYGCSEYNRILEKVGETDQSVRQWVLNMSSLSPEEIATYSIKMVETDSLNRVAVASILDKDGWPEGLTDKANKAIWLVIVHSDIDFQEKYLPYIERKVEEGVVEKAEFAALYDKMMKHKGLPQRYGTQVTMDILIVGDTEESKTYSLWPVEDMEHLDSIRASAGLPPIDEYLEIVSESVGQTITKDTSSTLN